MMSEGRMADELPLMMTMRLLHLPAMTTVALAIPRDMSEASGALF